MSVVANFKAMPLFIKLIAFHGFSCVVLFLVWLSIYAQLGRGTPELSTDAWVLGPFGIAMAIAGLLMPISAVLLLYRVGLGRYVYLSCFGIALVVPFAATGSYARASFGLAIVMLLTTYLFFNQAAAAYFSRRL